MDKEKQREYDRKYYQKNKERIKKRVHKNSQENRERINECSKKYYYRNKKDIIYSVKEKHKKNRYNYFHDKCCSDCGSISNLQLHHVNPKDKTYGNIWLWGKKKRIKEIEKCIIICHDCHVKIHIDMGSKKGENSSSSKLTRVDVVEIKKQLKFGSRTYLEIAKDYSVSPDAIGDISRGKTWSYVNPQECEV